MGHYCQPTAVLSRYDDYAVLVEQASAAYPHITRRLDMSGGEPLIRGSRVTVRHIVERTQTGQSVDDILAALPHLSAAEVYAALACYRDRRAEMDARLAAARPEIALAALARQGLAVQRVDDGSAVAHQPAHD